MKSKNPDDGRAMRASAWILLAFIRISKREVQNGEIGDLVDRLFDGAADQLIAGLIDSKRLTKAEIDELKRMVEKLS